MSGRPAIELADLKSFVCVVETGSIARAASRQGIAKSIISRRINRLECVLGATLLVRAARGTSPTDIGRDYYLRATEGVAQLEQAQEAVGKAVGEVSGPIRVSIPHGFGETYFAPLFADFAREHPRIQIDLCFEDRTDVIAGGFDLAVQAGNLRDSSLITKRLTKLRTVIVASPAYLDKKGRPSDPTELAAHDLVVDSSCAAQWTRQGKNGYEHVRINSRLRTNNKHMLVTAARADIGIVAVPFIMVSGLIDSGEIEIVLPDYTHEDIDVHLLVPPARVKIARVRALMDYLSGRSCHDKLSQPNL